MRDNLTIDPDTCESITMMQAYQADMMYGEEKAKFEEKLEHYGFKGIAGMQELRDLVTREVLFPLQHPDLMKEYRLQPLNGMLLYGPPGCGKTYFAEKFAEESGMFFQLRNSADITSKYIHESAQQVHNMFENARNMAPCVLCIDEIEALVPARNTADMAYADYVESTSVFLSEMNNCGRDGVFVIGTTNAPWLLDQALLRTGRMDLHYYVGLPDHDARMAMIRYHIAGRPLEANISDEQFEHLVTLSEGMNASDLDAAINRAALHSAIKGEKIMLHTIEEALEKGRRSIQTAEKEDTPTVKELSHRPVIGFSDFEVPKAS